MSDDKEFLEYKVVVMGAGGSGKSCLTNQFVMNVFTENYDPTIEDSYTKRVTVDGEEGVIDILDTAGQEEYQHMLDRYMKEGQGFICVYSITDPVSFSQVQKFKDKVWAVKDRSANDTVPFILVGNKCDLEDRRLVTTADGMALAKQYGCQFFESSAKTNLNVAEIFSQIVREIRKDRALRGYNLKKTKGPDEQMKNKILSKIKIWGNIGKLFSKFTSIFKKSSSGGSTATPTTTTTSAHASTNPTTSSQGSSQPHNSGVPTSNPKPLNSSQALNTSTPTHNTHTTSPSKQEDLEDIETFEDYTKGGATENDLDQLEKMIAELPNFDNEPTPTPAPAKTTTPTAPPKFSYGGPAPAKNTGGPSVVVKATNAPPSNPAPVADNHYKAIPPVKPANDFSQYPWFHGNLSSAEADLALANAKQGTFLIRNSSQKGFLAVSYVDQGAVQKALIQYDSNGFFLTEDKANIHPTLGELVKSINHILKTPYTK